MRIFPLEMTSLRHKMKMNEVGYLETEEEESPGRSPQEHQMRRIDENEGVRVKIRKLPRVSFYCTQGRCSTNL